MRPIHLAPYLAGAIVSLPVLEGSHQNMSESDFRRVNIAAGRCFRAATANLPPLEWCYRKRLELAQFQERKARARSWT